MMRQVKLLHSMLAVLALLCGAAWSQTILTDVWKEKDQPGGAKKVAVLWIIRAPQNRLLAENEFVRQLKARGLVAMPGYVVVPPDKLIERDAAVKKIKDLGVDALIVLRATDKKTVQSPIAGPEGPSRLPDYYQLIYDTPVKDESGLAYLEMNLFDVKTERRVWSARSVTMVDTVDQKAISDFVGVIIERLAADRLLP